MEITNTFVVKAPIDEAWATLTDVETIAPCIPGFQLQEIEGDEYRGTMIDGGETRQLKKGDVVIVPKGTPHWFKQVDGTFLYYVVKVR